MLLLQG